VNKNLTISLSILATLIAIIIIAALTSPGSSTSTGTEDVSEPRPGAPDSSPTASSDLLVREDSRHLDEVEDAKVTVVEFLDFECEACGAQYPILEQIREDYDGQINFVIRYFPLDGHSNSRPAAAAVEAAAQQGALEEMYARMFETQAEWGESQESQVDVFTGFAEELDLDMSEFTETMESDATAERVQADFDDGVGLGVQGTPTIFVNGVETSTMPSYEELFSMIEADLEE